MRLMGQQTWGNPAIVTMVIAVLVQSPWTAGSPDSWSGPINHNPSYDVVNDPVDYKCPYQCDCFIEDMQTDALWINCTYSSFGPNLRQLMEEDLHPEYTHTLIITCSYSSIDPQDVPPESELWPAAFSRLRGLRELEFDRCFLSKLQRSSFDGLFGLKTLTIRGAELDHVEMDVFSELPGLKELEISYSSIRYLPPVCSCSELEKVNLTGNHLSSFDDSGVYCKGDELKKLEVLDVNRNFLTEVPRWLGDIVPNLYRLGIADNYIYKAPENAFKLFKGLHVLDMTNNSFTNFAEDLFSGCKDLIDLSLSDNNIRHLTPDLLSPLPRLRYLEVANMGLGDDLWMEVLDQRQMTTLNISHNLLTTINDDALSQFLHLENLYASNNKIRKIPKTTFAYQFKLQVLDLSFNEIPTVPKVAFDDQHTLSEFHLDHNSITSIDDKSFLGLKQLMRLDLAANRIPILQPNVLRDLLSLEYLDISDNRMVHIAQGVFDSTTSLEYLNASFNLLSTPFPLLSKANYLKSIDLSHNNISSLFVHTFRDLSKLTYLNISHNTLASIPNNLLSDCENLKTIDLSHNEIKALSDAVFSNLYRLQNVDMSYNQIMDINRVFSHAKMLTDLNLSNNKLTQVLRGNFPQSIQNLNLEKNDISFISDRTFKSLSKLRMVNLQRNRLISLSRTDIDINFKLLYRPVFLIRHNPFVCDCRLGWLKDWMDGKLQEIAPLPDFKINSRSHDFVCTSPFFPHQKAVTQIERSMFLCNYTDHCDSSCVCCDFDSCHCKFQCPSSCHCFIGDEIMNSHQVRCTNARLTKVPQELPEGATDLRLDGNKISVLHKHTFLALKHVQVLYINNSQVEVIQNSTFKGLKSLRKLYLHDNFLTTIYDVTFEGLEAVEEIYLQNNGIFYIDTNAFLTAPLLTRINLQGNALTTVSIQDFDRFINRSIGIESRKASLSLSRNSWSCNARFSCKFLQFVMSNSEYIDDISSIECTRPLVMDSRLPSDDAKSRPLLDLRNDVCVDNTTIRENVSNNVTARAQSESEMYALIATCVIAAFIVVLIVVGYTNRHLVQLFCFTRFGFRAFKMAKDSDDNERPYDAFISYSNKDEDFVVRQLAPRLEKGDKKFRLCVHYRDFPVGACIAETIVRSVEASKRTILVVSDNFLESEWCRFEFQTAHQQVLSERCNRVILILMHNIDVGKLDNTLKAYMRTRTYLKYDDTWFWEKLMFAMPDVRNRKATESFRMARPPSNREIDYLTRDSRMGSMASQRSHSHQQAYPPFLHNGNYPHSCCDVMRNDMYEIPVSEGQSEHYQLAKIGAIFPHTNSAFHYTEKSNCGDTTSGYHNGSTIGGTSMGGGSIAGSTLKGGGSSLPPHYEEVGPGQYSLNSTPQKKLLVETPPPLPRIPKEGFVPRDRMTFV